MLFLGRYEYAMDDRGRIPIPPRFREELSRGLVLTFGTPDRCVRAFSAQGFEAQADAYMREPGMGRRGRVVRRALFARAFTAELDRQGRVLIPTPLRRWAELEGQVVVVGIGEGFEIWNGAAFEQAIADEETEFADALEALKDRLSAGSQ